MPKVVQASNLYPDDKVIEVTLSVSQVRDIFAAAGKEVDYICHALYTHIRSKVGKKKNFFLTGGGVLEIDKFERSKFCYYTLHEAEKYISETSKMSHQVMSWLQKENDFGVGHIYSDLTRILQFNVLYVNESMVTGVHLNQKVTQHEARLNLLNEMVSRGASDLKLRIMYL